jgi:membrane associated rhomboid family serine protease
VYDAPSSAPIAAYVLALAHVFVFITDYALYRTGHGNGGDVFLRLAQVDDALVFGGQWLRPWTACLVDYGLAQFFLATLALLTVGAETEAMLGTTAFLTVYVCSSTAGVLAVAAVDANTSLGVGGSDAVFGLFGAMAAFSAINAEPEWNPSGVAYRSLQMLAFGSALGWIAGLPTLGAEHVVSNLGHSVAFTTGAAMAYFGGAPLFVSRDLLDKKKTEGRDAGPGPGPGPAGKKKLRLTDALEGKKDKTYVGLGVASGLLALESVFVLVQRTLVDSQ